VTPHNYIAHNNLGSALFAVGERDAAKKQLLNLCELYQLFACTMSFGAKFFPTRADWTKAIVQFRAAARFDSKWVDVPLYLARSLSAQGKTAEATSEYRKALQIEPDSLVALNNLAWILASSSDPPLRSGPEAVRLSRRACELTAYRVPVYMGTLAAAFAETRNLTRLYRWLSGRVTRRSVRGIKTCLVKTRSL